MKDRGTNARGPGKAGIAVRCAVYALLAAALAIVPPQVLEPYSFCVLYHITGRRCPGCGMTRAFCCILHGQLARAWAWNPASFLLFPVCAFLAADELRTLVGRVRGNPRRSAVERLFGGQPVRRS